MEWLVNQHAARNGLGQTPNREKGRAWGRRRILSFLLPSCLHSAPNPNIQAAIEEAGGGGALPRTGKGKQEGPTPPDLHGPSSRPLWGKSSGPWAQGVQGAGGGSFGPCGYSV